MQRSNLEDLFSEELDKLNLLSKYSIEYGILTEDGLKTVKVNVLNPDDSVTETTMKVADVMYFTENGTITLPARHILEKSSIILNNLINTTLDQLVNKIFSQHIDANQIDAEMTALGNKIEMQLKQLFSNEISNINKVGSILNINEDKNKYLYDLNKLKDYIKCKVNKSF